MDSDVLDMLRWYITLIYKERKKKREKEKFKKNQNKT